MAPQNPFVANLKEIQIRLNKLAGGQETGRMVEYSFNSSAWKVLKEIKKPESAGGWPVDSGVSRALWGFKRLKLQRGKVTFEVFNDAPALRGRLKGHAYAGWVYKKGGTPPSVGHMGSPLIARGIVNRAILATLPTVEKNFNDRLSKYLAKRPKK
jgi:hypothetical protein